MIVTQQIDSLTLPHFGLSLNMVKIPEISGVHSSKMGNIGGAIALNFSTKWTAHDNIVCLFGTRVGLGDEI